MRFLPILSLLLCTGTATAQGLLIQTLPLAGSQYHALAASWNQLQVGDWLELRREPDNRHDRNAIQVLWRGQPLGYLPRAHNPALAAAMDGGLRLSGRIARLNAHPDPWQRVRIEVYGGR